MTDKYMLQVILAATKIILFMYLEGGSHVSQLYKKSKSL